MARSKVEKIRALAASTTYQGEAETARRFADKLASTEIVRESDTIRIETKVVITRHKLSSYAMVDHFRVSKFLEMVKPGIKQTYRNFVREDFSNADFYVMLDWAMQLGLVEKQGSSYIFDRDVKKGMISAYNSMLESLKL